MKGRYLVGGLVTLGVSYSRDWIGFNLTVLSLIGLLIGRVYTNLSCSP
jgi:hypothetical protein